MSTEPDPEPRPMPCQRIDPLTGGSCGQGPGSPTHTRPDRTHDYAARDRRNRDRRDEDERNPLRHPNRAATPSSVTPDLRAALEATIHAGEAIRDESQDPNDPTFWADRLQYETAETVLAPFRAVLASVTPSEPTPSDQAADWDRLAQAWANVMDVRRIGTGLNAARISGGTTNSDDWHAIAAEYARLSEGDSR